LKPGDWGGAGRLKKSYRLGESKYWPLNIRLRAFWDSKGRKWSITA